MPGHGFDWRDALFGLRPWITGRGGCCQLTTSIRWQGPCCQLTTTCSRIGGIWREYSSPFRRLPSFDKFGARYPRPYATSFAGCRLASGTTVSPRWTSRTRPPDGPDGGDRRRGWPARRLVLPDDARLSLDLDAGLAFAKGLKPRRVGLPDLDLAFCCPGRIGHKDTLRAFASNLVHLAVWATVGGALPWAV